MISQRFAQLLACGTMAIGLSSCGMFGSKSSPEPVASVGAQEFDPYSQTWKASGRVVTPPPSQPNATLAEQSEATRRENTAFNKAGRAMSDTAGAVGRAMKKPLEWMPFGKKEEAPAEEVLPAVPVKTAAQ